MYRSAAIRKITAHTSQEIKTTAYKTTTMSSCPCGGGVTLYAYEVIKENLPLVFLTNKTLHAKAYTTKHTSQLYEKQQIRQGKCSEVNQLSVANCWTFSYFHPNAPLENLCVLLWSKKRTNNSGVKTYACAVPTAVQDELHTWTTMRVGWRRHYRTVEVTPLQKLKPKYSTRATLAFASVPMSIQHTSKYLTYVRPFFFHISHYVY